MSETSPLTPCIDSNDCQLGQFCYDDIVEGQLLCDCSNWYGWSGENCDEVSVGLVFIRIFKILILLGTVTILLLISRTMVLNIFFVENPKKFRDPVTYTGLFIWLSTLGLTVDAIMNLIVAFDPTFFDVVVYNTLFFSQEPTVNVKGGFTSAIALSLSFLFYTLASLSMVNSWYSVIDRVSRFQTQHWQVVMKRWSQKVKIIMVLLVVVMLVLLAIGFFGAILVMVFIVFVALSITNFVVGNLFISTLIKFNADNTSSASLSISLIRSSFMMYRYCAPLFCTCIIAFFITLFSYQDNSDFIGDFNFSLLARDLASCVALVILLHNSWYVNSVTEGALLDTGRANCLFTKWDSKNLMIMGAVLSSEAEADETLPTFYANTNDVESKL